MIGEDFYRELKESLYLKLTETIHRFLGGSNDKNSDDPDDVWKVYIKQIDMLGEILIYISVPELQYTMVYPIPLDDFFRMDDENDINTIVNFIVNNTYEQLMDEIFL